MSNTRKTIQKNPAVATPAPLLCHCNVPCEYEDYLNSQILIKSYFYFIYLTGEVLNDIIHFLNTCR